MAHDFVVILDCASKVKTLDVGENDLTFYANDFSAVPVALFAAAALGATGTVLYRRQRKD